MNARVPAPVGTPAYPPARLPTFSRWPTAFEALPLTDCRERLCAVFHDSRRPGRFLGVLTDPAAIPLQRWVEARLGAVVLWHLAPADELAEWLNRQVETSPGSPHASDELAVLNAPPVPDKAVRLGGAEAGQHPVVRLLNATLVDALRLGASDIHLEATETGLAIRYRIDGVLEAIRGLRGSEVGRQVISRLKVLAELDIAETRVPQDGRLAIQPEGKSAIDLRVSIMPSLHGEDAVLRILDKQSLTRNEATLQLSSLGFDAEDVATLHRLAAQPYGMLLASGPTGSGKTTSLYALLQSLNHGHEKIITIEDPVEYRLPGILQIPVNDKKGLTFARGLRSILRHDPDTLMVGEIRDRETAEIAIQSALTGHRVLSTVHANQALDVFGRFLHMGIDPYLLGAAVNGIFAQRLLRRLCPECAVPALPGANNPAAFPLSGDLATGDYRTAVGCPQCRHTGYRGRSAIVEILAIDDALRDLVGRKAELSDIRQAARERGLRSLHQRAMAMAQAGLTSLEEVARVTARH